MSKNHCKKNYTITPNDQSSLTRNSEEMIEKSQPEHNIKATSKIQNQNSKAGSDDQ